MENAVVHERSGLDKGKHEGEGCENTPCKSREAINTWFRFVKDEDYFTR